MNNSSTKTTVKTGKFITIDLLSVGEKTNRYGVFTKDPNYIFLGEIKWFGRWRKYSFFPAPDTVFENECMETIGQCLVELMKERRQKKD